MSSMSDSLRFTPAEQAELDLVQSTARGRHERARKAAKQRGRVDFPLLPYECSWAFEEEFRRRKRG
jgi:hypothetical protein